MIRLARLLKETALTLGAVFGVLCVAGAIATTFFGVSTLIFRSGSMAPAIHTGALALAQRVPAADIRVGDVVSAVNAEGTRITHRVVALEPRGGGSYAITLRGDANEVADPTDYLVASVDRVFWHVDGLGYLAQAAQTPIAVFGGGLLVGGIVVGSVRGRRPRSLDGEAPSRPDSADGSPSAVASRSRTSRILPTALLAGVLLLPLAVPARPTLAQFTGTATASMSFSTPTTASLRPVFIGYAVAGSQLTVTWSDPAAGAPDRGYAVNSASSSAEIPAGTNPYSWTTPLVADDIITITARHFANWSAGISVRVTTASDGSVTCSVV